MPFPIRPYDATDELVSRCKQLDEYDLSTMPLERIHHASHFRPVARRKNERVDDTYSFSSRAPDEVRTEPFDDAPKTWRAELENLGDRIDRQVVVQSAKRSTFGSSFATVNFPTAGGP
jgi:hypothetical protein